MPTLFNTAKIKQIMPLILIFALAVFLRVYNISHTTIIKDDTGRDLLIAKHLAQFSAPLSVAPLASSNYFHNTPFYYLILGFLWILAPSPQGIIVLFSLVQSLVIFIGYFLGKLVNGKKAGYYFALYVAITPHFVEISRWIWQPNLLALFIPLLVLLFLKISSAENYQKIPLQLFWFFVIANACLHLHYSSLALVTLMFIFLIKNSLREKQKFLIITLVAFVSLFFRFATGFNFEILRTPADVEMNLLPSFNQIITNVHLAKIALHSSLSLGSVNYTYQSLLTGVIVFICIATLIACRKVQSHASYQSFMRTLCVLSGSGLVYLFYLSEAREYYFLPFIFVFHLLIASMVFYLIHLSQSKKYTVLGVFLGICLMLLYLKNDKYFILYWRSNEIYTLQAISKNIAFDIRKNTNRFSLEFIDPTYGITESRSTFNASLWLFLEEQMQKKLVEITDEGPIIVEPSNFEVMYRVTIHDIDPTQYTIQKIVYQ